MPLQRQLPPLPQIGHTETYYARLVHDADRRGDLHAREAGKVGQYITLGLDPHLSWPEKLRYFRHALRRHCTPPPLPDEDVWTFYRELAQLIRRHAGEEALRLAMSRDEFYAQRLRAGSRRDTLREDAEQFFATLTGLGDTCPDHFTADDWEQLTIIRAQWV